MEKRKEQILNIIIEEHIKTGYPVGSGVLVEKYHLHFSPATVRNEMSSLEEEGFIAQPHTSAGRIPTEKAYKKYINELNSKNLPDNEKKEIENVLINKDEISLKEIAKIISRLSGNAVFLAFHRHNLYYTGISNLFQQPEFRELNLIVDISTVIDSMDEIVNKIFDKLDTDRQILIGSENPFGDFCSTIIIKYKLNDNIGIFGILGPMRMDYEKNIALVDFVNEKLLN
jgi:heat-inducible transcriptional repressor